MAKSRRKPSASQRDKFAIEEAKILKAKGVLSKQTKLHGGRFISKAVLKRTKELKHLAFNVHGEKPSYVAIKVSRAQARQAIAEGYQVVGGGTRVVVPKEHDMIARVRRGELAGIVPVKGGFKSEVTIPFNPENSQELMEWLQSGDLEKHKLANEMFMFTFHGSTSRRGFNTAEQMRQYLEHYKQDELMKALKIFRLHPDDQIKLIDIERVSKARGNSTNRGRQDARGNYGTRRSTYRERMERLERSAPLAYKRAKKREAEKHAKRMEKLKADPKKHADYVERNRARALAYYHANKPSSNRGKK